VRRLAYEATDCGLLSPDLAAGKRRVKGVKKIGVRLGNWLTPEQSERLWNAPDSQLLKGKRDRALLAVLLACGLRRHEAVNLDFRHVQQREDHWAIVELKGKAGHTRTVPMPSWVKTLLDEWLQAANLTAGKLFRRVNKNGKTWGDGLTEKAVWHVVREPAHNAGVERLAPHDLRRTCARLCHSLGGELAQIQFSSRARPHPNDRTLSGLQAAHSRRRQRLHRHRTETLNRDHRVRVADHPHSSGDKP
jgi:integrase